MHGDDRVKQPVSISDTNTAAMSGKRDGEADMEGSGLGPDEIAEDSASMSNEMMTADPLSIAEKAMTNERAPGRDRTSNRGTRT